MRSPYGSGLGLLMAPYLLGMGVLIALPGMLTFALAFFHYDTLSAPLFAGLANVREMRTDPLFPVAVWNSLHFILWAVPLRLLAALGLAVLLQGRGRGVGVFRTCVYLPTVIPEVAYALIWLWILNPIYGPLNLVLGSLGLPQPEWLLHPESARMSIVLMSVFQVGEGFVVLLAALQGVPRTYLDAAAVDGASPVGSFRHIVLPLLAPWLLLLTLRDVLMSLQYTFTPPLVMTEGGPYYATLYLPLLIYGEAFSELRFGAAAMMMLLMFLGLALLLGLVYVLVRDWGHSEEHG